MPASTMRLFVGGLLSQTFWSGAMDALADDPARSGWWRPVTAVFLQNGGRALSRGVLVPHLLDWLAGDQRGAEPRNFVGSSGATFSLGALTYLAVRRSRTLAGCAPSALNSYRGAEVDRR